MEKKYFLVSITLNILFWVSFLLVGLLENYEVNISSLGSLLGNSTWYCFFLVALLALLGFAYIFFAKEKRWVLVGLAINLIPIISMVVSLSMLKPQRP